MSGGRLALMWLCVAASVWCANGAQAQFGGAVIERYPVQTANPSCQVVVCRGGDLFYTAQLLPLDAQGRVVAPNDRRLQVDQTIRQLELTLAAAKLKLSDIVKLNVYCADDDAADAVRKGLPARFPLGLPAVCYVTTSLPHSALVALDAVARSPQELAPFDSPRGLAPGVHAEPRRTHWALSPEGSRVYVAGQAEKGDLRGATKGTLQSLERTLKFLGLEWADVVQIKSFVTPMSSVAQAEDEFVKFFGEATVPPLAWVEWKSDLPIEIELVASANRGRDSQLVGKPADLEFLTPPGMTTPTIYSRVVRTHGPTTLFVSGLYGEPGESGEKQVERIFQDLEKTLQLPLADAGDFRHLAKATYYVSDDDASGKLNALRPRYYDPQRPPAASKALVRGVGLPKATITIDMIAVPKLPPPKSN